MKIGLKILAIAVASIMPTFAEAKVNVAVVMPQEGEYKVFGEQIINGAQTAVDLINEDGGLHGEEINLIKVNDPCEDGASVVVAKMLADNASDKDKISMVIGPYCTNKLGEINNIYAHSGIIQIIPVAIPKPQAGEQSPAGLIKLGGYKERQSEAFYQFYKKLFGGKQVAIIYDSMSRDMVDLAYAIQQEFKKNNEIEYVKGYNYATFNNDYGDLTDKVLEDKNEVAYIMGTPQQIAEVASLIKEEKERFPIFTNKYKAQEDYDEIMGKYADTIFYLGLHSMDDVPEMTETIVDLRLKGVEPEGLGMYGYLAVRFWEAFVNKADSFEYGKIAKVIQEGGINFPWGTTNFKDGVPEHLFHYGIYIRHKDQYTQVY